VPLRFGDVISGWRSDSSVGIEPEPGEDDRCHDQDGDDPKAGDNADKPVKHPAHHQTDEETDSQAETAEFETILLRSDDHVMARSEAKIKRMSRPNSENTVCFASSEHSFLPED